MNRAIGAYALILGVIGFDIVIIAKICETIWVGRKEWTIDSSYKQSESIGDDFAGKWISNDAQKKEADIVINISKERNTKGRLISNIRFVQGTQCRWAYPLKWAITLTDKNDTVIPEWDTVEKSEESFGKGIEITLSKPQLVRNIAISIIEPKPYGENSPTHARYWAFNDIVITEVRIPWIPKWRRLSWLREGIIR